MTGIAKAVPVIDIGSSYRRTHFTGIVDQSQKYVSKHRSLQV